MYTEHYVPMEGNFMLNNCKNKLKNKNRILHYSENLLINSFTNIKVFLLKKKKTIKVFEHVKK